MTAGKKMSPLCDLHTHTTASDGQYTPAELVELAKRRGLDLLAVTDHDTIAGVGEAQQAGSAQGVTVIRGVELSAKEYSICLLQAVSISRRCLFNSSVRTSLAHMLGRCSFKYRVSGHNSRCRTWLCPIGQCLSNSNHQFLCMSVLNPLCQLLCGNMLNAVT